MSTTTRVQIVKHGSLPSMIRWYVRFPPGTAIPESVPFRTRTEARDWCDRNSIPWRTTSRPTRPNPRDES